MTWKINAKTNPKLQLIQNNLQVTAEITWRQKVKFQSNLVQMKICNRLACWYVFILLGRKRQCENSVSWQPIHINNVKCAIVQVHTPSIKTESEIWMLDQTSRCSCQGVFCTSSLNCGFKEEGIQDNRATCYEDLLSCLQN